MRHCATCDESKPLEEFVKRKDAPGGVGYRCKPCERIRVNAKNRPIRAELNAKARRKRWENIDKARAKWRATAAKALANPGKRAKIYARNRARYAANPELFKEYQRRNRAENYEQTQELVKRWRKQNKGRVSEFGKRRRARRSNAAVCDLTIEEWQFLIHLFNHKCAYCKRWCVPTQDHLVPLSRGGNHTIENVVPSCQSCNSKKATKTATEFGFPYETSLEMATAGGLVEPLTEEQS